MSKVDQLRAMREARYARQQQQVKQAQTPAEKRALAERVLTEALKPKPPVEVECGHQGISGKRCIRPVGHTEKNHRYGKTPPAAAG